MVLFPEELESLAKPRGGSDSSNAHLAVSLYLLKGVSDLSSSIRSLAIPSPFASTSTRSSKLISGYKLDLRGQVHEASSEAVPAVATDAPREYGEWKEPVGAVACREPIPRSRRQNDDWEHDFQSSGFTAAVCTSNTDRASRISRIPTGSRRSSEAGVRFCEEERLPASTMWGNKSGEKSMIFGLSN